MTNVANNEMLDNTVTKNRMRVYRLPMPMPKYLDLETNWKNKILVYNIQSWPSAFDPSAFLPQAANPRGTLVLFESGVRRSGQRRGLLFTHRLTVTASELWFTGISVLEYSIG